MERTKELDQIRRKKNIAITTRLGQLKKELASGEIKNIQVKRLVGSGILVGKAYEIVMKPLKDYLALPAVEQLKLLSEKNVLKNTMKIEVVKGDILSSTISFGAASTKWGPATSPRPIEIVGEIVFQRDKREKNLSNPKIVDAETFSIYTNKAKEQINTTLKKIYAKVDTILKKEGFDYYAIDQITHSKEMEAYKKAIEKEYDFSDLTFDDIDLDSLTIDKLFKDETEKEVEIEIKKEEKKPKEEPKPKKEKKQSLEDLFGSL